MDKIKTDELEKELKEDAMNSFRQFNKGDINDDINARRLEMAINNFFKEYQLDDKIRTKVDTEDGSVHFKILFGDDELLSNAKVEFIDPYAIKIIENE